MGLFDRLHRDADKAIDLTDEATADAEEETLDLSEPAPSSHPHATFGSPTRCPRCDGRGFLDHLDMIDRIQYQHCLECGHKWELTESELIAGH